MRAKTSAELIIGKPSEKQKLFLKARSKHVAFGGARGGGKSWAVRAKAKLLALRYPGIRIVIIRRSYPELINNHINELRRELVGAGLAKYNDRDKALRFGNGSVIDFQYCENDADLDRLQGVEYDVIFLDEATQLSEYQMRVVTACLRGVNTFPKRIYYTCNPGGQGHGYVKRLFIDRAFREGEDPLDYTFIQSRVYDNKVLLEKQPDYVKQLEALPPKLRAAWLEGRWDIFEGQFFEEFRDDPEHYRDRLFTHVVDPFMPDRDWNMYRSFDWGYSKPFSCGWWAVDCDGVAYRVAEWYGCSGTPNEGLRLTAERVFSEIRRIEDGHPYLRGRRIRGVADPAIFTSDTGQSIAETAEKQGVFFERGDHARIPGWMQMHYRLAFDENGRAMMYIFKTCRDFIRTLPLLRYDPRRPEDLDSEGEDHAADEARYFCMMRPIAPRRKGAVSRARDLAPLDIEEKDLQPFRALPEVMILGPGGNSQQEKGPKE